MNSCNCYQTDKYEYQEDEKMDKKRALLIRLLENLQKEDRSPAKDIAIIGISGRYPGSETLEEYWQNLKEGRNCIREIPGERWNPEDFTAACYSKWGGFINDADKFDPLFFNISPREAAGMDPQERLFLETAWALFEDAGYTRDTFAAADRQVGVFVGVMNSNYELLAGEAFGKGQVTGAHTAYWSIANRVSYTFDFQGPSMAVDTACSSSLTAIHLACESLKRGECQLAIAGGVNLILHPLHYQRLCQINMLTPGNTCKSFGRGADGFVDGEGVGAVLLKPLDRAIFAGDKIYGVIKGSAVNAGGKTSGYTVPNPNAQARLISTVLEKTGINPRTIGYVEAHGTGTSLGDPIEIAALVKAYQHFTLDVQFCSIGSVKSNIGHLESAAGIAGLTKLLLQLKHKQLVPSLHSRELNPHVDFKITPFHVQQELADWPRPVIKEQGQEKEYPRRAAISSFGAGGANAHIIIEEFIANPSRETSDQQYKKNNRQQQLIILSAQNQDRLKAYAMKIIKFIDTRLGGKPAHSPASKMDDEYLHRQLEKDLLQTTSDILHVDPGEIQPTDELAGYAVDVVTFAEVIRRLNEKYSAHINPAPVLLRDYPSISLLSRHLAAHYRDIGAPGFILPSAHETREPGQEVNNDNGLLADIAYTLQVGREAMKERLAAVVTDIGQLREILNQYSQGKKDIPNLYLGNQKNNEADVKFPAAGSELTDLAGKLMDNQRFGLLANLWVSGMDIDWKPWYTGNHLLYTPRLISLPTYPFARERYWVEVDRTGTGAVTPAALPGINAALDRTQQPVMPIQAWNKLEQAHYELDRISVNFLLGAFQKMGVFRKADEHYRCQELKKQLKIIPLYSHLFDVLLEILAKAGYIKFSQDGNEVTAGRQVENPDLENDPATTAAVKDRLNNTYPEVKAFIKVVWACLENYPQILQGEIQAVDILFPGSSMDLMEGVYKGNEEEDFYNQLAAWALLSYIRARIPSLKSEEKIKILEIGAGTGGTSALIFKALRTQGYGEKLLYFYTDISMAFTRYGRKEYGAENPYAEFHVLDIEKELTGQGYKQGDFEVVIATNVLHATRNIRKTLANIQVLLKAGAWLIINEGTAFRAYTTISFGLLAGWWLFEDEQDRLHGAPLLGLDRWEKVLTGTGYQKMAVLGQPADGNENAGTCGKQHVIIARGQGMPREAAEKPVARDQRILSPAAPPPLTPVPDTGVDTGESNLNRYVEEKILDALAKVLQMDKNRFHPDTPYSEVGVDSILAIEIIDTINQELGISLRSTDLFNYSTIRKLTVHTVEKFGHLIHPGIDAGVSGAVEPGAGLPGASTTVPVQKINREMEREMEMEVAVIGMACRFPEANHPEEFWQNLAAGKNSSREVSRWDLETFYDPDPQAPGRSYSKWGCLLSEIDGFDSSFFNISPKEAELMDPQQRLFLEEAWKAMEDAGYSDRDLDGEKCGVFVGFNGADYDRVIDESGLAPDAYYMMGNFEAVLAARISYFLNLRGPAIAVNTACSASLAALHLAWESIRAQTCKIAIAGGVMALSKPLLFILTSKTGMLAPDGLCKTFDNRADGFVPGEGAAALVLKPLAAARRDGDHIYGVITGSGMNQDGKTSGIAAPSAASQTELECEIYDRFHIDPSTITYVEAHGTGTKLGDPIEVDALTDAFRKYTSKKQFCAIGSVKTNIGHTMAAAGAAGLIKVLLSMKYKKIPPTINFQTANEFINFEDSPFYVSTHLHDWKTENGTPRRAAVSSFGVSGTNVHMVVREAPLSVEQPSKTPPYYLIPISARTETAFKRKIEDMVQWLEEQGKTHRLTDISYTLLKGRSHFSYRAAWIAEDVEKLSRAMTQVLQGEKVKDYLTGVIKEGRFKPEPSLQQLGRQVTRELHWQGHEPAKEEYRQKLLVLADLYTKGYELEWEEVYRGECCQRLSLPTYPFEKLRYWVSAPMPGPGVDKGNSEFTPVYFQEYWQEAALSPEELKDPPPGNCIVFDTGEDLFHELEKRLNPGRVILVKPGDTYQEKENGIYELDIRDPRHYDRLVESLCSRLQVPGSIIHWWSKGNGHSAGLNPVNLEEKLNLGFYSLFYLTRALMQGKPANPVRLLYIYSTAPGQPGPWYGGVSGFCKSLGLENPDFIYRTLELQGENPRENMSWLAAHLLAELNPGTGQVMEVCYRGESRQRYIKQVKEVLPGELTGKKEPADLPYKQKGVYLVTGGAGGLGMIFARYLASRAKATIVLTGRSPLSAEKELEIGKIKDTGAQVVYIRADISRRSEVQNLIHEIKSRWGDINGIIHSAGVTRDAFILKKTEAELAAVLAAKVYGTLFLDEAAKDEPLDFFVLFSSLSAVLGNVGQCDYAYANSFLDHFAQAREEARTAKKRCGRTITLDWPYWQDGGMHIGEIEKKIAFEQTGITAMPTPEGIAALELIYRSDLSRLIIVYGNREKIEQAFRQRYLAHIRVSRDARSAGAPGPPAYPGLLSRKTGELLKEVFAGIIKMAPERVDLETPFERYGIDSLMITQFNSEIEKKLGGAIPKTLLFEYRTLQDLTGYFVKNWGEALERLFGLHQPKEAAVPDPVELTAPVVLAVPARVPTPQVHRDKHYSFYTDSSHYQEEQAIAIIGMSGRYPFARNPGEFWENLEAGKDCITTIPHHRWDYRDYYHPQPQKGKIYCKWGGFIDDVDKFDPLLFNISSREAETIDPQERLLLEAVWTLLEDAGYNQKEIHKSYKQNGRAGVGVFVGVTTYDYHYLKLAGNYDMAFPMSWSAANRVSFTFNFQGPSMPVDTACSSSLTALHLACQSLKKGECRLAVLGGVNIYLHPVKYIGMCAGRMLSAAGKCHTFGEKADGFVPGEGVGALLLKPLTEAVIDNDHIYAVIRGSAINHGGRTNGYTVPNPRAQANLIRVALQAAHINPRTITYVEAHGTGTSLGDPIEIDGLTKAYREYTPDKQYCAIGSVKSNIGHLESAAGIAGLTKVILQMRHKQLVPSLHAEKINPNIDFENSPFYIQRELAPWEQPLIRENGEEKKYPRRAAVSSFGAGGANAHVIIEEWPGNEPPTANTSRHQPREQMNRSASTEYQAQDREQQELFILSARNKDQLKTYAGELARFLEKIKDIDLPDIAYTLQLGRETMNERMAITAAHIDTLREKLSCFCRGEPGIDGLHTGNIKENKGMPGFLLKGKAGEEFIGTLIKERDFDRLARLWVSGVDIDWHLLYPGDLPKRITLPTYPFARHRYWVDTTGTPLPGTIGKPGPHPLIDQIHAGLSLEMANGLVFQKNLSMQNPIVNHHRAAGRCILPGVGYLEMALAAASQVYQDQNSRLDIRKVLLLQPLEVQQPGSQVQVLIKKDHNMRFEVRTHRDNQVVLHARGEFRLNTKPAGGEEQRLSIEAIKSRCTGRMDKSTIYSRFEGMGLDYGPYFQGLEQIFMNEQEALGYLELPPAYREKAGYYTLHPTMMDGALQTIAGLVNHQEGQHKPLMLPFSFQEVEIWHPTGERGYAYARGSTPPGDYQVVITDETGWVCVRLHQVTFRELKDPRKLDHLTHKEYSEDMPGHFFYMPRWQPCPLPPIPPGKQEKDTGTGRQTILVIYSTPGIGLEKALADGHPGDQVITVKLGTQTRDLSDSDWEIDAAEPMALHHCIARVKQVHAIYFLGGLADHPLDIHKEDDLEQAQERGVYALFRLIKALNSHGFRRHPLRLKVITNGIYSLFAGESVNPAAAALPGLTGSAAREYPAWQVCCVDIRDQDLEIGQEKGKITPLVEALKAETGHKTGEPAALRQGCRYVRILEPVRLPPINQYPFRQKGVYLILGGAGGIGLELGLYLAQKVQARLILIGRHPLPEHREQKIKEIEASGGEVLYLQADGTDLNSMTSAVARAKSRFGQVNGVFHSAIILQDSTLENMEEETLKTVLAPKVKGSVVLYRVLQREPLDFIMFFSSLQAFVCSPGQANYAAACTFKDAFAQYLSQQTPYPVKIINWGYWGSVGIVSLPQYQERMAGLGLGSITPAQGMEAVRRVLAHPVLQIIPLAAEKHALEIIGIDLDRCIEIYPERIPSLIEPVFQHVSALLKEKDNVTETGRLHEFLQEFTSWEQAAPWLVLDAFQEMGVLQKPGQEYHKEKLKHHLCIVPGYWRLYEELLGILARADIIRLEGNQVQATHKVDQPARVKREHLLKEFPRLVPYTELLFACTAAYPEVLTGRKNHMELMFPGGSMKLVGPVYKGNPAADFFNRLLTLFVGTYIRTRVQASPETPSTFIHVLEVGAGTGGTTAFVLEALKEYGKKIHYTYTDISDKFLQHGEKEFAGQYPFLEFKMLDIEKPPAEQGFTHDSFDLVLATNVVHATKRIHNTVSQLKKLLKTNGVLVINEGTRTRDFSTLTFGLTGGWWLYEDEANRCPGSPFLSTAQWRQVLEVSGFRRVCILKPPATSEEELMQGIIISESNGQVSGEKPAPGPGTYEAKIKPTVKIPAGPGPGNRDKTRDEGRTILEILSQVLRIDESEFDREASFQDYGVDSLLAVEIIDKINERLGMNLRATDLFNFSTLEQLTAHAADERRRLSPQPPGQPLPMHSEETPGLQWLRQLAAGELEVDEVDDLLGGNHD
jgi:acyl transferase domain-containing protein/acyl carrier protein/SAM-dependent methyltransferase